VKESSRYTIFGLDDAETGALRADFDYQKVHRSYRPSGDAVVAADALAYRSGGISGVCFR